MSEELTLDENSYAVWKALQSAGPMDIAEIADLVGVDQSQVTACAAAGVEGGFMELQEQPREELVPSEKAEAALNDGVPERRAAVRLAQSGGRLEMRDFIAWSKESQVPANEVFKWGPVRGWLERVKGEGGPSIVLADAGQAALESPDDDERALRLALAGPVFLDQLSEHGIEIERVRKLLARRPELARIKKRTQRTVSLTHHGEEMLEGDSIRVTREQNALSPEDIESGAWRNITLRPYDVTLPARELYPAKIHPLRKIMEETRRAFLEMGFSEVVSPMVESAFWNFDALFQPQDHPARDMQDTFYMADPEEVELPDRALVEQVRRTHEDGGTTGSEGWGYSWSRDRARKLVLRTHTTAATIRALAQHPQPPGKFFCVGWTFRNETISFKHLPVFHQVDGIIIDEQANLTTLLGTLQEFYRKMGFGRVKFKPAFYPYTEPSVDVVVYMESRGKWLEMGGSGLFRPEVTEPLGCKHPVLAWGLGIERLAMLRYGFSDIRELYRSNLDTLEEVALCR